MGGWLDAHSIKMDAFFFSSLSTPVENHRTFLCSCICSQHRGAFGFSCENLRRYQTAAGATQHENEAKRGDEKVGTFSLTGKMK